MNASHEPATRARRRRADLSFGVLLVLGICLILLPFLDTLHDYLDRHFGALRFVELVLGFALLYVAFLVRDLRGVRERNLILMETMLSAFRGAGIAPREREAVDILIAALQGPTTTAREAAFRQLERLTGQRLGTDVASWQKWWEENRESFRARSRAE